MATITRLHSHQNIRTTANELKAFLVDAEERHGLSTNTFSSYRCYVLAARIILKEVIDLITLLDIESFLVTRNESPPTSNRCIPSLRQFFRWTQYLGYRADNPVDRVEAKHDDEKLPRPIRYEDLKMLDKAIGTSPQPYRLIFKISRETGMRPGSA